MREWRNWKTQQPCTLLASNRLRGSTPLSRTRFEHISHHGDAAVNGPRGLRNTPQMSGKPVWPYPVPVLAFLTMPLTLLNDPSASGVIRLQYEHFP
jgi:hypothetical protein